MKNTDKIDDLMLNAFVDGQLDAVNCEAVLKAMEYDHETRERVYLMRRAKDLIKIGFEKVETPLPKKQAKKQNSLKRRTPYGLAASVCVLLLGFGSGVLGYYMTHGLSQPANVAAAPALEKFTDHVVLHLSESDPGQFSAALNYIENFLDENQKPGSQIEIIANSGGLDLMRSDKSPYKARVVAMMRDHDNVHFIACANGIRNLRKQGDNPPIIEDIDMEKTAIDHIIGRLQAGWKYVKVDNIPEI